MNVSIGRELEEFIKRKVATGDYASASEVVRDGLRLLKDREREREVRLQAVREKIQKGLDQIDAGLILDGEEVMEEIRQRIDAKRPRPGE